MTTAKIKTITIKEVAELVATTFESHGFDINMLTSKITAQRFRNGGEPTGTIEVDFGERPAEGQAGFAQKTVTPSFEIFNKDFVETNFTNPWAIWDATVNLDTGVRLRISYEHHGGGQNGFSRDYQINERTGKGRTEHGRYYLTVIR